MVQSTPIFNLENDFGKSSFVYCRLFDYKPIFERSSSYVFSSGRVSGKSGRLARLSDCFSLYEAKARHRLAGVDGKRRLRGNTETIEIQAVTRKIYLSEDSNDFKSKPFKAASTNSGNLSGVQPKQGMFNLLILFASGSL